MLKLPRGFWTMVNDQNTSSAYTMPVLVAAFDLRRCVERL